MPATLFDDLTDAYEAMIDWPKRLAREEPFFQRWFDRVGARSIVDAACGTRRHAPMFHSWGMRVEGADLSAGMIERARSHFGEPPGLRWRVRGFDQPIETSEPFDAAICTGNSLALADNPVTVERAIERMVGAVRPGGLVILHVLNLWPMRDGLSVWQKCVTARLGPAEVLIVKGVRRHGDSGRVELIVVQLSDPPRMQTDSAPFLGLEAPWLEASVRRAGAGRVECFGDYQERPYDRGASTDLILVARK